MPNLEASKPHDEVTSRGAFDPVAVGDTLAGKWRLDRLIGTGGMASIYAATHVRNGSRAAIKVLRRDRAGSVDTTTRERFLREGYVANAVGHPGVVRVLDDAVTEKGDVFLVMELLEGETLEQRRRRSGGVVPLAEAYRIADKLLEVLITSHARGIVHRDIKPENVFLTRDGEVKVLDFGIARMCLPAEDNDDATLVEMTLAGSVMGTLAFMSPEQASGSSREADGRADVWSVGATLFTLLSSRSVHEGTTMLDRLVAASSQPARALGEVAPDVPAGIAAVIDRALRFDRNERWPDAVSMRLALSIAYFTEHSPLRTATAPATAPVQESVASVVEDVPAPSARLRRRRAVNAFAAGVMLVVASIGGLAIRTGLKAQDASLSVELYER